MRWLQASSCMQPRVHTPAAGSRHACSALITNSLSNLKCYSARQHAAVRGEVLLQASWAMQAAATARPPSSSASSDGQMVEAVLLPFDHREQLLLLEQLVRRLLADDLQAGPQLLELLSAFEVTRSNLLRPAGYFADFLQEPEQQQAARQLMQQVGHVTQHVYANTAVLHLLLDTVAQALQQLVEAAAQQGIQAHHEQRPVPPTSSRSGHKADGWGLPASEWQQHFVQLHPGLAVAEGAAAAAAAMAQHACELLQSVTAAHTADSSSSRSKAGGAASTAAGTLTGKLMALRASLSALDTAISSSIPCVASSGWGSSSDVGSHSSRPLQHLMVARQLLAGSWLPPLAAAAAAATAHHAVGSGSDTAGVLTHCNGNGQAAAEAAATQRTEAAEGAASQAPAVQLQMAAALRQSAPAAQANTTKQLLQSALQALSAISNSSTANTTVAPLLLMTEDQAAVIQPLLRDAGLDTSSSSQQIRTPWVSLTDTTDNAGSGTSGSMQSSQRTTSAAAAASTRWVYFPIARPAANGVLLLQTSAELQVHEGPGGVLHLLDLISVTEQAQQLLQYWQEEQQQQQQVPATCNGNQQPCHHSVTTEDGGQQVFSSQTLSAGADQCQEGGCMVVPAQLPLRLLRLSSDVLQLLLRHHPHPGVRQQVYISGLQPLLQLQQQVLAVVVCLRRQLAAEHAESSFTELVLSGSCLGSAGVAASLMRQLQPVLQQHAAAEFQELQQLAARKARAAGRWDAAAREVDPWDIAHATRELVQQVTDLDWGRDLAPYFTLPGLINRIDTLLSSTCGLRLLPADSPEAAAALQSISQQQEQQQQLNVLHEQQQKQKHHHCDIKPWGPHVIHLVLLDSHHLDDQQQHRRGHQHPLLLGHVFIELVAGWGFPFCSLLQLPAAASSSCWAARSMVSKSSKSSSNSPEVPGPGAVVIRLPVPAAEHLAVFGKHYAIAASKSANAGKTPAAAAGVAAGALASSQQQTGDALPLVLPGPAALQALLHELGHALSYLCPYTTLQQLLAAGQQRETDSNEVEADVTNSSASATLHQQALGSGNGGRSSHRRMSSSNSTHVRQEGSNSSSNNSGSTWLFNVPLGMHSLCLLSGPAAGVDTRELSSHLFEYWVRHPASLMVLSCHERLGVPLPQRTALQLPQLLLAAPGGCSSMRLHHTLLEAQADLKLHNTSQGAEPAHPVAMQHMDKHRPASLHRSSPGHSRSAISDAATDTFAEPEAAAATAAVVGRKSTICAISQLLHDVRSELQHQSVAAGAAVLDDIDELAACVPVGGAKAAYLMARLLAAAAWKALGLEQQPVGGALGANGRGGRLKRVLLRSGSFQPGHHTVIQLLGSGAGVLTPELKVKQLEGGGLAASSSISITGAGEGFSNATQQQHSEGPGSGSSDSSGSHNHFAKQDVSHSVVVGWMPNLVHDVYQDLDLV